MGGTVVGLSSIDGYDASENETSILMGFTRDVWYHIRLRVANDSIKAWIDNTIVVDFTQTEEVFRSVLRWNCRHLVSHHGGLPAIRNIRLKRVEDR
jgi:hypothetical protein